MTLKNTVRGLKRPNSKRVSKARSSLRVSRRYVLTFKKAHDPSTEEVSALKSGLKGIKVLDEFPGTLLIEGDLAQVKKAVDPLGSWQVAPEGQLTA